MKSALFAAAAIAVASTAHASVFAQLIIDEPTLTNMPGWQGVTLRLTSDSGNIIGIDFGDTGANASKGIFMNLGQRWATGIDPETELPIVTPSPSGNVNSTTQNSRDSFWTNQLTEVGLLDKSEDNNLTNGSNPPWNQNPLTDSTAFDNGVGSYMHYRTGIDISSQSITLDIAYLVVPHTGGDTGWILADGRYGGDWSGFANAAVPGSSILLRGLASVVGSQQFDLWFPPFQVDPHPVAEPAVLAPVAVLGLLMSRRRQR